ncbi:MAG: NifU family protein [Phycisphaerales bacterium]
MARLRPTISSRPIEDSPKADAPPRPAPESITERVSMVIDLIRPAVQADGGDVELVEITPDNLVRIRLHGACVGCPSSSVTLQVGIERNLREHVPEIRGVEAIE